MTMINNIKDRQISSKAELIACLKEFIVVADNALSQLGAMDEILASTLKKAA